MYLTGLSEGSRHHLFKEVHVVTFLENTLTLSWYLYNKVFPTTLDQSGVFNVFLC